MISTGTDIRKMEHNSIVEKVRKLAGEVASLNSVELVDVEMHGKGRGSVLRVFIDKKEGVALDDCVQVSRELEALLDVEDPIQGRYTLEVSSPGLDRPLLKIEDFETHKGKKARVVTEEYIEKQTFFVGTITDVSDDSVTLDLGNKSQTIPFAMIKKARLEIDFGK